MLQRQREKGETKEVCSPTVILSQPCVVCVGVAVLLSLSSGRCGLGVVLTPWLRLCCVGARYQVDECTFQPQINPKSKKTAERNRTDASLPVSDRLYRHARCVVHCPSPACSITATPPPLVPRSDSLRFPHL